MCSVTSRVMRGFLVIARDSKLVSLKQPEKEEDVKEDRSRMVSL